MPSSRHLRLGATALVAVLVPLVVACRPTGDPEATRTVAAVAPEAYLPSEEQALPPSPAAPPSPVAPPAPVPAPALSPATSAAPARPATAPAGYPFGQDSVWSTEVRSAPVSADSAATVAYLAASVHDRYGGVAAFNEGRFSNSYYVADAGIPRVDVAFNDCQDKGYVPDGLTGPGGQFSGVPVPADAVAAPGTDKMISIFSPDSDQLWEFWEMEHQADGRWSACWGGRIDMVSQSPGYFSGGFGATATGLSATGGMVSLRDVRTGRIQHALSLVVPNAATYRRVSWPAQRSDGWDTNPAAVPEGTRLRLDPSVDIDALGLTPVAAMIARAAQTYGFIVADKGGAVAVVAEHGADERALTGHDPWDDLLGGAPSYLVMKGFPWERLQALPQDYGKP